MSALPNLRDDLVAGVARHRVRHRRSRHASAAIIVATAVATAIVLPGGSTSPSEALAQVAQRTADFTSGRIVWTTTTPLRDERLATTTSDVRYDGARIEIDRTSASTRPGPDEPISERAVMRVVDGTLYGSSDGATFHPLHLPGNDRGATSGNALLAQHTRFVDMLASAVKSADDVTTQVADGVTTYTGIIDTTSLAAPAGVVIPAEPDAHTGQNVGIVMWWLASVPSGPTKLQISVRDDVVRTLAIANGDQRLHAQISDLGKPQNITAP